MQIRPNLPPRRPPAPRPAPVDPFTDSVPDSYRGYKWTAAVQVPQPMAPAQYYDGPADARAAQAYYGRLPGDPKARFSALRELVTRTHTPLPGGYDKALKVLYGQLDRHPDGVLRSVYSQRPLQPVTYTPIALDQLEGAQLNALAAASLGTPEVLGAWLAFQKGMPALNCEHVVPQDCFNRKEPMRSDLHHLFACDCHENTVRGNQLYNQYEPADGKGKVARATLYFMLRHPQVTLPYSARDVARLKEWSLQDPPDLHELHRNAEIQRLQGNRNPFIDHPEWVKDYPLPSR